jgi:methyltransferase
VFLVCGRTNIKKLNLKTLEIVKEIKKTPLKYWGGKQQLLRYLLPLIPEHRIYNEPFLGGGALFFAKPPAKIECINDINDFLITFYRVLRSHYPELKEKIENTLYSESEHERARLIYANKEDYPDLEKAWAVFVLCGQSIFSVFTNGWLFSAAKNEADTWNNRKELFCEYYKKRLRHVSIFCRDALRVIKNTDKPDTFHFLDPPYINTTMGHYSGYSEHDFENLLELLSTIEGKFLLTSFPCDLLDAHIKRNKWYSFKICINSSAKRGPRKIEQITANYDFRSILSQIKGINEKLAA